MKRRSATERAIESLSEVRDPEPRHRSGLPRPMATGYDRPRPRRAAPHRDPARAAVRPVLRGRRGPGRRRARPRNRGEPRGRCARRLSGGVLRDLVGMDELHVVRLGLRHRRRALPAADRVADGGSARAGRRGPDGADQLRLHGRDDRLRDHAGPDGRAVAASGPGAPGRSGDRAPLRRRHHGGPAPVAREAGTAVPVGLDRLRRTRASPSSPCPSARSFAAAGRPRGIPSTSPSATACSRSSCSARWCSPPRSPSSRPPRRPACRSS